MKLEYGFLCDYAARLANGCFMVSGIFDAFWVKMNPGVPAMIPPHTVFFAIVAPAVAPIRHQLVLSLIDADANMLAQSSMIFDVGNAQQLQGPGHRQAASLAIRFEAQVPIRDFDAFEWVVAVDGERLGSIPFSIVEASA